MKTKLVITIVLASFPGITFSQEKKFTVTKSNVVNGDKATPASKPNLPDAEFRIKYLSNDSPLPDLVIPTYSSGRRRVADARLSKGRFEIVIQTDEFSLDYYDYRLDDEKWALKSKKQVCSLNGQMARRIAQIDILDEGIVDIKLHKEGSNLGKSGWDKELLMKDHKEEKDMLAERYVLKNDGFLLVGEAFNYRPMPKSKAKEDQKHNKPQQDNK